MTPAENLRIQCPDCDSEIVIDRTTGEILYHQKATQKADPGKSFDALVRDEQAGRERANDLFEREKASLEDHDRLMEEKFRQALERVDEDDDSRPERPFDLD